MVERAQDEYTQRSFSCSLDVKRIAKIKQKGWRNVYSLLLEACGRTRNGKKMDHLGSNLRSISFLDLELPKKIEVSRLSQVQEPLQFKLKVKKRNILKHRALIGKHRDKKRVVLIGTVA